MEILVKGKPETCEQCLFLGTIIEKVYIGENQMELHYGCTLLNTKIPKDIRVSTRLGNCPLKDVS